MKSIQRFWFVAWLVAERMAISPLPPDMSKAAWISVWPIFSESAWLTWVSRLAGLTPESSENTLIPFLVALVSTGCSASRSLPTMQMDFTCCEMRLNAMECNSVPRWHRPANNGLGVMTALIKAMQSQAMTRVLPTHRVETLLTEHGRVCGARA